MALFFKNLKVIKKYDSIKPFSIEFKDGLNIIVGENGSGKSTLLHLMQRPDKNLPKDYMSREVSPCEFHFFDTEKMNPRLKTDLSRETTNYGYILQSHFISHGESMLSVLKSAQHYKNALLLVDEPEAGLSIKNQCKILEMYKRMVENNNCQVIITTHSYVMISNVGDVFDMERKKWITSKKFLERQMK